MTVYTYGSSYYDTSYYGTDTLIDISKLIRSNKQRPVRKLYIKRRTTANVFEDDWVQIDHYSLTNRVVGWGSVSLAIDDKDGRIGSFNCSNLTLTCKNDDGLFNVETDERSLWFGYLNRKFTKVKVDVGYLDSDGNEVGVATIFEGIINKVRIGEDQKASVEVLSYQTILNKYDIVDLSLTGARTVNNIIRAIMNQTKITKYIPYTIPDVDVDSTITDTSLLTGTYWDVIKDLAYKSNSVPLMYGSSFQMVSRSLVGSVVWAFLGKGNSPSDIFKINSYDDEGADRVRVFWIVENSAVTAKSTDATLLAKYLDEPQNINLDDVDAANRQDVVDALLAEWENPKPVIEFTTRFLINQVKPLDIITIDIGGQVSPTNAFKWGAWVWGDGSVWGKSTGSILINDTTQWKVTSVSKNIDSWQNVIKAEKYVL